MLPGWTIGWDSSAPLPLLCLLDSRTLVSTVHPYLLAFQVPVAASSRHIISSAAGTEFFWCQLEAEILKNKTWPILSIICFHQGLDQHSGTTHHRLGTILKTKNPVFFWVSGHIFTCVFQMQFPALKNLWCFWLVEGQFTNILLGLIEFSDLFSVSLALSYFLW